MQFERRQFLDSPLDILVGHPEHEMLFVATQAARAAGLSDPKNSMGAFRKRGEGFEGVQVRDLLEIKVDDCSTLDPTHACGVLKAPRWKDVWLCTEASFYEFLMRGHSDKAAAFRAWLRNEVVPSLRKSGTYTMPGAPKPSLPALPAPTPGLPAVAMPDLEVLSAALNALNAQTKLVQSQGNQLDDIRRRIDALASVVHAIGEQQIRTHSLLLEVQERPLALPAPKSPYEGTRKVCVDDVGVLSNQRVFEKAEAQGMSRPVAEKYLGHIKLAIELLLEDIWKSQGGPSLDYQTSRTKRKWTSWPETWLLAHLTNALIQEAARKVLNEQLMK